MYFNVLPFIDFYSKTPFLKHFIKFYYFLKFIIIFHLHIYLIRLFEF